MKKFTTMAISDEDISKTYDDDHQWMAFKKGTWIPYDVEVKRDNDTLLNMLPIFIVTVKQGRRNGGSFLSEDAKKELEAYFGDDVEIRFIK